MIISKELEIFLKNSENQKLINKNTKESWEEVYDNAYESLSNSIRGQFTEILLKAGIDPAKIMGYIPALYLFDSNILKYKIPNNIISIGERAFAFCHNLTSIEMGDSLNKID